jgi:hypothetical protein
MSDHADPVPAPQSSNEEPQAHLTPTPRMGPPSCHGPTCGAP